MQNFVLLVMSFRDAEKRELCSSVQDPGRSQANPRRSREETTDKIIVREIFRECMHGAYNELRANQEKRRTAREL